MTSDVEDTPMRSDLQDLENWRLTSSFDGEEEHVARIVFSMMFFLRDQNGRDMRRRLFEAEKHCRQAIGTDSFKYIKLEVVDDALTFDTTKSSQSAQAYRLWEATQDEACPYIFKYDASPELPGFALVISAMRSNSLMTTTNTFQPNLPVSWFIDGGTFEEVEGLFGDLAKIMRPRHAQSGFCVSTLRDRIKMITGAELVYPTLRKHPHLMSGWAINLALKLGSRMNTIGRITAVHKDLLSLCGDHEKLGILEAKGKLQVSEYGDGLVFQLPHPPNLSRGMIKDGHDCYGVLARYLKPARATPSGIKGWDRIYADYQKSGSCVLKGEQKIPHWNEELVKQSQIEYLSRMDGL